MVRKRIHPRARTLKAAKIVLRRGHSLIDCIVRNLSVSGAAIHVESPVGIPENFVLRFGISNEFV